MMPSYIIERGNTHTTKGGKQKFATHSSITLEADSVPAMLLQLATDHTDFLYNTDGLIWKEMDDSGNNT